MWWEVFFLNCWIHYWYMGTCWKSSRCKTCPSSDCKWWPNLCRRGRRTTVCFFFNVFNKILFFSVKLKSGLSIITTIQSTWRLQNQVWIIIPIIPSYLLLTPTSAPKNKPLDDFEIKLSMSIEYTMLHIISTIQVWIKSQRWVVTISFVFTKLIEFQ